MRKLPLLLLAGAMALGGTAAFAASNDVHHMNVRLPDGGVASIEYTGNVAPKVSVTPMTQAEFDAFAPDAALMPVSFARIQADMDRQMNAMLEQVNAMNAYMAQAFAQANAPIEATLNGVSPDGANAATLVSTANGGNFCARSVEVSIVNGKKNVVRHQAGNCGASTAAAEHAPAHHGDRI
ncbi:MAG: hypothetical protein ACTHLR_14995 [Rhizomicrobium sp.]